MSLKRQTLWSMAPLIVVTAINVISVPLFYRYLGAEMYALWFYVLTFTGAFGFMDLGLGVAIGRYIGIALGQGDGQAVKEYWGTGNAIGIPLLGLTASIFIALGVFFGPGWFNVDPSNITLLRWSFVAGGAGLFLAYYGQFWLILSSAHLDFKSIGALRTFTSILQVVLAIPLAALTRNPLPLIIWSAIVAALQLVILYLHARKSYGLGFEFASSSGQRLREIGGFTGKSFAYLVASALLGTIDRLLLGKLAPPIQFTHYTICTNVGSRIQGLSQAVMGPVFSNTSQSIGKDRVQTIAYKSAAAIYNETFAFVFPWILLGGVWITCWHSPVLRFWLGPELGSSVAPLFVPIFLGFCLNALGNISGAQLAPLDRVGAAIGFSLFGGFLLAVCVVIGWNLAGMKGVAWSFFLSRVSIIGQDLFVLKLIQAGGWLSPATWRSVLIQIGIGLLFYFLFHNFYPDSPWQLIPAAIHLLTVAISFLWKPASRLIALRSSFSEATR